MGLVRKIKAGLVKISVNDFIGEDGNIFFDIDDGIMRLSDGTTPGGIPLSTGGGEGGASTFRQLLDTPSTFAGNGGAFVKVNPQASALEFVDVDIFDGNYANLTNTPTLFDGSSISESLLPSQDVTYDLGSATNKWRDLYLSGNTIFLGTTQITRNNSGGIDLPANSRMNGHSLGGVTSYNDLTDLPTLFDGAYASLTGKPSIPTDVSDLTDTGGLLSGGGGGGSSYTLPIASNTVLGGIKIGAGLSVNGAGLVTAFSGNYNDLTNTPTLFSGAYADLTGIPSIPADVSDLTDTTNLLDHFSGSYNDLTDKPTIPTVPTTISSFTNDSGYITNYTVTQADVTAHQAALTITESQISDLGNYELADTTILKNASIGVTVQAYDANIVSDANYLHITVSSTSVSDGTNTFNKYDDTALSSRVTTIENAGYITGYTVTQSDVTQHQAAISITESQISNLQAYLTSVAFSDLTTTPTTIAGYGITDAYTKTETDNVVSTAVSTLIGDAPAVLDTLSELADAIGDDANFLTTLNSNIALKANIADLATVATSGSYNDLTNQPDVSDLADRNNVLAAAQGVTDDDALAYSIIF